MHTNSRLSHGCWVPLSATIAVNPERGHWLVEQGIHFLSPQEVGARLSVSRDTVYSWIRSGKLRASRPGGRLLRVSEQDLAEFLTPSTKNIEGPVLTRRRFTFGAAAGAIASVMFSSAGGACRRHVNTDPRVASEF